MKTSRWLTSAGYSTLGYLKQFPVDVLKIDRSFVSKLSTNADDAAIVRSHRVDDPQPGYQVVAEGRTAEQLAFLRSECECDFDAGLFLQPASGARR